MFYPIEYKTYLQNTFPFTYAVIKCCELLKRGSLRKACLDSTDNTGTATCLNPGNGLIMSRNLLVHLQEHRLT
jgi:hypothetical protein